MKDTIPRLYIRASSLVNLKNRNWVSVVRASTRKSIERIWVDPSAWGSTLAIEKPVLDRALARRSKSVIHLLLSFIPWREVRAVSDEGEGARYGPQGHGHDVEVLVDHGAEDVFLRPSRRFLPH